MSKGEKNSRTNRNQGVDEECTITPVQWLDLSVNLSKTKTVGQFRPIKT